MRTSIVLGMAALILSMGCNQTTSLPIVTKTNRSQFKGYTFEFAHTPGQNFKNSGNGVGEDGGENLTATCGDQTLKIINGKMRLNDVDKGMVKQGDTIKLSADGKVWVNGEARD